MSQVALQRRRASSVGLVCARGTMAVCLAACSPLVAEPGEAPKRSEQKAAEERNRWDLGVFGSWQSGSYFFVPYPSFAVQLEVLTPSERAPLAVFQATRRRTQSVAESERGFSLGFRVTGWLRLFLEGGTTVQRSRCAHNCGEVEALLLAVPPPGREISGPGLLWLPLLEANQNPTSRASFLQLGATFHPLQRTVADPYFGLSASRDACGGCAVHASARLGLALRLGAVRPLVEARAERAAARTPVILKGFALGLAITF